MSSTEFSKALLKSASIDAPPTGAKARAMAHVGRALGTGAAVGTHAALTATAATTKVGFAVAASALIAGAAGIGGGYALGHASSGDAKIDHEVPMTASSLAVKPPPVGAPSSFAAATPSAQATAPSDSCNAVSVESSEKCSVSGGRTVTFALKNECSHATLDVFWVDNSCHEIFRGLLSPSEVFWRDSYEGQAYRIRDHVTHRLLKEFSPVAVGGAPDRANVWKGPPTELATVTIAAHDAPLAEVPPAECSHGGGRAAMLHVRNERSAPIALSVVNSECREVETRAIDPGAKLDLHTSEGHAFRVRDASGAILLDIPPTSLDTTTYLNVP